MVGLWPCRREGDDVLVLAGNKAIRLPFLRQQVAQARRAARTCAWPTSSTPPATTGSAASRSAIHGIEPHLERFRAANDDYSDILLKALADRLAEAFAERLHEHVRKRIVGLWRRASI